MIETMHKLEFASQPENIAIIERLIDEIRDNNAFDDECYGDVLIAMTEAVNNAIVHSWAFSGCSLKISGFSVLYMARK